MTHLSRLRCLLFIITLFAALFSAFFSAGCGGGTSGTGVKSFEGVVRSLSGAPIENAQITIVQTGETTTTNSEGQFEIRSKTEEPNVEVALSSPEVSDIVSVTELPPVSAVVSMNITVDSDKKEVTSATIEVTPTRSDNDSNDESDDAESSAANDVPLVVGAEPVIPSGSTLIQGRLLSPTGEPLSGIVVTIPRTGISTVTDSEGNFVLDAGFLSGSVGIEFSADGLSTSVDLGDLPDDAATIDVQVELDLEDSMVSSVTVEVVNNPEEKPIDGDIPPGEELPPPDAVDEIPLPDDTIPADGQGDDVAVGSDGDTGVEEPGDTGVSDGSDVVPPDQEGGGGLVNQGGGGVVGEEETPEDDSPENP